MIFWSLDRQKASIWQHWRECCPIYRVLVYEPGRRNVNSWFSQSHPLGYKIGTEGIHPLPEKVEAIKKAPSLTCVMELSLPGLTHVLWDVSP